MADKKPNTKAFGKDPNRRISHADFIQVQVMNDSSGHQFILRFFVADSEPDDLSGHTLLEVAQVRLSPVIAAELLKGITHGITLIDPTLLQERYGLEFSNRSV